MLTTMEKLIELLQANPRAAVEAGVSIPCCLRDLVAELIPVPYGYVGGESGAKSPPNPQVN